MTAAANRKPSKKKQTPPDKALVEANVNPRTGFATDYLNHFNEAIMLLELLTEGSECLDDFFAWQPKKYDEHFTTSKSKHRKVALAAYADADPVLRERLDTLADSMNQILMATREVMRQGDANYGAVANLAVRWVRPLLVRTSAVINGIETEQASGTPQVAVDALLAR
jgi:hypothetical protein